MLQPKKFWIAALPVALLAVVPCSTVWIGDAFGHGGVVQPPPPPPPPGPGVKDGDEVGGGPGGQYRGPTDTAPPTESGGGPTTPGPSGPKTPKTKAGPITGGGRGPKTPGGGPVVGPPRGAITPGVGKKNRGTGGVSWLAWWRANRDAYVIKASTANVMTGDAGLLAGNGRSETSGTDEAAMYAAQTKILLGLRSLLSESDAEVVDSAVLVIARSVDRRFAGPLQAGFEDTLKSPHRTVRQATLLALGVLGAEDAAATLRAVLEGGPKARALFGGVEPDSVDRGIAAVSLGLLSDRASVPSFVAKLSTLQQLDRETAAGVLLGAGAFREEREAMAFAVGALLDDESLSRDLRALAPISLARLGSAALPFVPKLLGLATSRDADLLLRQSAVVALGRLCCAADREVIDTLVGVAKGATDGDVRRAALVAIGEAMAQPIAGDDDVAASAQRAFTIALTKRAHRDDLPWAALAAGRFVRDRDDASAERIAVLALLSTCLAESSDPELTAAYSLALGLARSTDATAMLSGLVSTSGVALVRGSAAEGLGLIGRIEGADAVREQMVREVDDDARASQALALGVIGDRRATSLLIDRIANAQSAQMLVSSALALGRLRDPAAIEPLLVIAKDDTKPGVVRGFACIALGLIGEKTPVRWNTPFCVGANPSIQFTVQTEIMDLL